MTDRQAATPSQSPDSSPFRRNIARNAGGGVLLLLALFLPWNVRFGFGVDGSNTIAYVVLVVVTVLSLGSIFVTAAATRLALNIGYLLFVAFIVVGDTVFSVIFGAVDTIPPGVGPGAWIGVAGALLCAQPTAVDPLAADASQSRWFSVSRVLGFLALAVGVQSFLFNMYWRVQSLGSEAAVGAGGAQQAGFVASAAVYGLMSLAAVAIAAYWMIKNTDASRLALTGLGAATLVTALVVWASDSGLGIVPFRGAVNNTTAGIGFQGYLIWAATAAIVAPLTLRNTLSRNPVDTAPWREALRLCLLLIGVWSVGQILMRLVYLALAAAGNVTLAAGINATLIGLNVVIAAVALWVRSLLKSSTVTTLVVVLCGVLFALTDARVAAEIILTASHITATFHVVLCVLALIVAAAALRLRQLELIAAADDDPPPRVTAAPRIVSVSTS
jgi:hypothetical protein